MCLRDLVKHCKICNVCRPQWVGYKQEIPDVSASWQGLHSQTWYMEGRQTMRNLGCGLLWFAQGLFIPADCIHLHYINCAWSSKCHASEFAICKEPSAHAVWLEMTLSYLVDLSWNILKPFRFGDVSSDQTQSHQLKSPATSGPPALAAAAAAWQLWKRACCELGRL